MLNNKKKEGRRVIELIDLFWVKEKSTICVAGTTNTVPIEYFYSNLNTFTLA